MDMPERLGLQNYLQLAFKKYSGLLQPGTDPESILPNFHFYGFPIFADKLESL